MKFTGQNCVIDCAIELFPGIQRNVAFLVWRKLIFISKKLLLSIKTGGWFKQCMGKDKMAYLHFVVVASCNGTSSKRPSANLLQSVQTLQRSWWDSMTPAITPE